MVEISQNFVAFSEYMNFNVLKNRSYNPIYKLANLATTIIVFSDAQMNKSMQLLGLVLKFSYSKYLKYEIDV